MVTDRVTIGSASYLFFSVYELVVMTRALLRSNIAVKLINSIEAMSPSGI